MREHHRLIAAVVTSFVLLYTLVFIRSTLKAPVTTESYVPYEPGTVEPRFVDLPSVVANLSPSLPQEHQFLLIVVLTQVHKTETRNRLRDTLFSELPTNSSVVFLVGTYEVPDTLRREQDQFNDILSLNMLDSYRNLTTKVMAGFREASKLVPSFDYIVKVDDDTWIDLPMIGETLSLESHASSPRLLWGKIRLGYKEKIRRDESFKYRLTIEEYPFDSLPLFAFGPAYIIGYEAVEWAVSIADGIVTPVANWPGLIWLEDVNLGAMLSFLPGGATLVPDSRFENVALRCGNMLAVHRGWCPTPFNPKLYSVAVAVVVALTCLVILLHLSMVYLSQIKSRSD